MRLPAGQGGGSRADLVRIFARVLPLFHAMCKGSPVDLTAPFTLRARVSSMYGSEMYVCCSAVGLCGDIRLLCWGSSRCVMMRCRVCSMRLCGYPLLVKIDAILSIPRFLHSEFDPSLIARSI